MTERTEFGFTRSKDCSCQDCVRNCKHMSGFLVPSDLERIAESMGYSDLLSFSISHLSASPGAVVMKRGKLFRVPTLVPKRDSESGRCKFLDEHDRCSIHAVSPYGCAFFDAHMTDKESSPRASAGINSIIKDGLAGGQYAALVQQLADLGVIVDGPETTREKIRKEAADAGSR